MPIELLQYNEVTRLVEDVSRTNPPPEGASFCVWFYIGGFKHIFGSSPLYADVVDALDAMVTTKLTHPIDDARIVWRFMHHTLRQRLIRFVRPIVTDPTNIDALERITRHLDTISPEEARSIVPAIVETLEALHEDQLSGALERLFLNGEQLNAELVAMGKNEKLNALLACCIQATKDAGKGRYANIGAFTALLDKRHNMVLDPLGFVRDLQLTQEKPS